MVFTWSASHISFCTIYTFLFFLTSISFCSAGDTITFSNPINDSRKESLVSAEKRFELGFFTPIGSSKHRRYVGIWYKSSPGVVVWVANRDMPLSKTTGVFTITDDGDLRVLEDAKTLWSAKKGGSTSFNRTVKLLDSGNLVLIEGQVVSESKANILWQSFNLPTDTFLPGMKMSATMLLTSWKSQDDPAPGDFIFQKDQDGENQYIVEKKTSLYWKSGVPGSLFYSDNNFLAISSLLSNFSRKKMPTKLNLTKSFQIPESFHNYRLVMNFNGKVEFYIWDNEKASWSLIWGEPEDKCSVFDACGDFSICNLGNGPMCKCLPGFESRSEGCFRKSPICNNNNNVMADHFLSLKMMKVGTQSTTKEKGSADECKEECLNDCNCQAYSYVITERIRHGTCYFWSNEVKNIQEQIEGGIELYVRVKLSDIGT